MNIFYIYTTYIQGFNSLYTHVRKYKKKITNYYLSLYIQRASFSPSCNHYHHHQIKTHVNLPKSYNLLNLSKSTTY